MEPVPGEITLLLAKWKDGEPAAFEQLMPLVYPHLREVAAAYIRRERNPGELQATALVDEVCLRLINQKKASWSDRAHFYTPVIYLYGPNTGWMLGTGSSTSFGFMEPQSATSITSGMYFFGTQMTGHLAVETGTGTATLASAGATGTGDNTSTTSPLQADQPVVETFTVNSDGTFSTSDHPGVVSGVIISNAKVVTVNNQNGTYPTILVISTVP